MRLRRALRALALLLLLTVPGTCWYSSVGLDVESLRDGVVVADFYRVRWPGDGSLALAWLRERRLAAPGDGTGVDLGAAFFAPAPALQPASWLQRRGVWWVEADAARGPVPPIVAGVERAWLVAVPQWSLALLVAAVAFWPRRRKPLAAGASAP